MAYVGIIYGVADRKLRRIVTPEKDAELDRQNLKAGENMVRLPKAAYKLKTIAELLRCYDLIQQGGTGAYSPRSEQNKIPSCHSQT